VCLRDQHGVAAMQAIEIAHRENLTRRVV